MERFSTLINFFPVIVFKVKPTIPRLNTTKPTTQVLYSGDANMLLALPLKLRRTPLGRESDKRIQTMFTSLWKERTFRRECALSRIFRAFGLAVLAAFAISVGLPPLEATAKKGKDYRPSGPYTQKKIAVYLIHREGRNGGPVPLTLGEAMKKSLVTVSETDDVERLMVRYLGDREVFIQAGGIVKGGKQDRVLVYGIIIPPNSAYLPSLSYCHILYVLK